MIDLLVIIWLIIFVIFLAVNLAGDSHAFGVVAGAWLLLLGLAIITTGVQIESGSTITVVDADTTTIEYDYEDATLPYSTYSYVWGIVLILIGVFMVYCNAEEL